MTSQQSALAQAGSTGILLALASAFAFALGPVSAKLAFDGGSNALTIVAIRSAVGAALLLPFVLSANGHLKLRPPAAFWCLACGAFYAVTIYGFIASLAYTSVSVAILIFFLHPLLIALVGHVHGTERLTPAKLAIAIGTLVVLAMALDLQSAEIDPTGAVYAGLSAITMTGMVLCSARANAHASGMQISLWVNLLSAVTFVIVTTAASAWALPEGFLGWLGIGGTALALAFGLLLFFAALRYLGPTRTTMLTNIEPLLSILFAAVLLGERLSALQWAGVAGVIVGLVLFEAVSRRAG